MFEHDEDHAPDISIIMPVFNHESYIDETLDAIQAQTGPRYEIICIDDKSTDGSLTTLTRRQACDARITVIRNDHNMGAGRSRNAGFKIARGHFVQFTDSDDILLPGALGAMFDAAIRERADVVRGGIQIFKRDTVTKLAAHSPEANRCGRLMDFPELWCPWWHQSFLISRRLIVDNKIAYPDLLSGEDPVFMARVLVAAQRICTLTRTVYSARDHGELRRHHFKGVRDYVIHAIMVREIFGTTHKPCWERYFSLLKEDIRSYISRCSLTNEQQKHLRMIMPELFLEAGR